MSSAHDMPVYQDASDGDSPISSNLLYKRRMTAPGNFAGITSEAASSQTSPVSSHNTRPSDLSAASSFQQGLQPVHYPIPGATYSPYGEGVSPGSEQQSSPFSYGPVYSFPATAGVSDSGTASAQQQTTTDLSPEFYDPSQAVVKHRRRTTAPQLKILEANFELSTKPDVPTRQLLADKLNMTPREVQVWFQNRRAKVKRMERKQSIPADDPDSSGQAEGPDYQDLQGSEDEQIERKRSQTGGSSGSTSSTNSEMAGNGPAWNRVYSGRGSLPTGIAQYPQAQNYQHPLAYQHLQPNKSPYSAHNRPQIDRRLSLPTSQALVQPSYGPVQQMPRQNWHNPWPASRGPANGSSAPMPGPEAYSQYPSQSQYQHWPPRHPPQVMSSEPLRVNIPYQTSPSHSDTTHSNGQPEVFAPPYNSSPREMSSSEYHYQPNQGNGAGSDHDFASYVASSHRQAGGVSAPLSSSTLYTDFSFGSSSGTHHREASTPSSAMSSYSYAPSLTSNSPSINYPEGFDLEARRASCPADFVDSFDQLSMPVAPEMGWNNSNELSHYTLMSGGSTPMAAQHQFEPMPAGLQAPGPRRHSVANGAGYAPNDPQPFSSEWVTSTASSASITAPFPNPQAHRAFMSQHHDSLSRRSSNAAMLDTIAETPYGGQNSLQPVQPGHYHASAMQQGLSDMGYDEQLQRSPSSGRHTSPAAMARKVRSHSNMSNVYKAVAMNRQMSSPSGRKAEESLPS